MPVYRITNFGSNTLAVGNKSIQPGQTDSVSLDSLPDSVVQLEAKGSVRCVIDAESGSLAMGLSPAGEAKPLQLDGVNALQTTGAGGGGGAGGTSDTKEATQLLVLAEVTSIDTQVTALNAKIPASPATVAGQDATNLVLGTRADAVATTDTGTFSLVAFVKRGLQNWTTLLSRLPASLGVKAGAASLPVVLASDQAAVPVTGPLTDTQLRATAVGVAAVSRTCTGRQTITLAAGVVTTLTVPGGSSVAAAIQADGNTVRVTLDGVTAPSATVGTRIDDGVIYYVDTSLANVKLFAAVACSAQVAYFDKA